MNKACDGKLSDQDQQKNYIGARQRFAERIHDSAHNDNHHNDGIERRHGGGYCQLSLCFGFETNSHEEKDRSQGQHERLPKIGAYDGVERTGYQHHYGGWCQN